MDTSIIPKQLGAELMLYDTDRDEVHMLNPTARLIYTLARKGKDLAEVEEEVRRSFCVDENQDVVGDIQECLKQLKKKRLLAIKSYSHHNI